MFISLRKKIMESIIPLIMILLLLISVIMYFSTKKVIKNRITFFVEELLKSKANEIGNWNKDLNDNLKLMAESRELKNPENKDGYEEYLKRVEEVNKDIYEMLFVTYINGKSYNSIGIDLNKEEKEELKAIVDGNNITAEQVILKKISKPAFIVTIPITDKKNKVVGVIGGVVLLEKIAARITNTNLKEKGDIGISDKFGNVLAHNKKEYTMKLNMKKDFKEYIKQKELKKSSNKKDNGKYFSCVVIPNTNGWFLGINLSEKEIYKDVYNLFYFLIIVLIIGIISFVILLNKKEEIKQNPLIKLKEAVKNINENKTEENIEVQEKYKEKKIEITLNKEESRNLKYITQLEDIIKDKTTELNEANKKLLTKDTELEYLNEIIAEKNNDLYKLATKDAFTGLYNRYELYRRIDEIMSKASRVKTFYFSLLIIDLDNFKYYNETLGNQAGDEVLKRTAELLDRILRENDILVRYSEEEFIVLIEERKENAVLVGEKIIKEFKNCKGFEKELSEKLHKKVEILDENKVMCSIGIYEYVNGEKIKPIEMIKLAGSALSKSKKLGKGRVCIVEKA